MTTEKTQATEFVARLEANSAAFCDDNITFATFHDNQVALWAEIDASDEKVQALVHEALLEGIRAGR